MAGKCVATFVNAYTYDLKKSQKHLALVIDECRGALCQNLPTISWTQPLYLKSIASGKVFNVTIWFDNDGNYHYPKTDSKYTKEESDGQWCYVEEKSAEGKYN